MKNKPRPSSASIQNPDEIRWTRGAQWTLIAAAIFVLLNIAQIVYRCTIPSLGWAILDPDTINGDTPYIELRYNAVGARSALEPGDIVQAVGGISAKEIMENFLYAKRPANWEIGKTVDVTILRDDQSLSFIVPIVHWTLRAWLATNFDGFSGILKWLTPLLLLWVGAFTLFMRPGNLAARFLFAIGLGSLSGTLGDSIPDYMTLFLYPTAGFAKLLFSNIIFAYLLGPSFLGYALTFPKPKGLIQRQPRWLLVPYLIGSVPIILLFTAPEFTTIGFALTFGMLLLGVIALVHSGLSMRDAISRAQLRWAVGGVITGAVVFMLNFASNVPQPYREIILFLASLGTPIIGLSLAMAILRYRLFDIDIVIRRTLQYSILTGVLGLTYLGGVTVLQGVFTAVSGQESPAAVVLSTLGLAVLFNPLRRRVQDFIDRRFYRRKYDAEKALAEFAAAARQETDLAQLSTHLTGTLQETLQPEQVSLWLKGKQ